MTAYGISRSRGKACLALLLVTLLSLSVVLFGCATGSEGTKSAEKIEIAPALGERYDAARELAEKVSPDSKLLVVSQVRQAEEDVIPAWQYSFVSWEYAQVFQVVFKNNAPQLGTTNNSDFTREELDAIPNTDEIKIDADEAYDLVVDQLSDDEIVESCFVYLMTYVKEDADPLEDAMCWFFVFNRETEVDPVDDTVITKEEPEDPLPAFAYRVDAITGEVSSCPVDLF